MNTTEYADDLFKTADQVGMKVYSDDFCAKLLAYLYVCGGGNEAVVMNEGLNFAIKYAQNRANLFGGEKPDPGMVEKINRYSDELEGHILFKQPKPVWFEELAQRYKIKI